MTKPMTRTAFLKKISATLAGVAGIGFFLNGCKGDEKKPATDVTPKVDPNEGLPKNPASCNDVTGLSKEDIEKRKSLGYVEQAPSPDMECKICKLYLPPAEGVKCGNCSLFKGYVDELASCTYFAPLDNA